MPSVSRRALPLPLFQHSLARRDEACKTLTRDTFSFRGTLLSVIGEVGETLLEVLAIESGLWIVPMDPL